MAESSKDGIRNCITINVSSENVMKFPRGQLFAREAFHRIVPKPVSSPPKHGIAISQTLQDHQSAGRGSKSKLRTPRTLTRLMQQHRDNERSRHRGLNTSIMDMSRRIPGYTEAIRETKVVKLDRIISYICHLEHHIQKLCEEQEVDLDYRDLFLSPHIKPNSCTQLNPRHTKTIYSYSCEENSPPSKGHHRRKSSRAHHTRVPCIPRNSAELRGDLNDNTFSKDADTDGVVPCIASSNRSNISDNLPHIVPAVVPQAAPIRKARKSKAPRHIPAMRHCTVNETEDSSSDVWTEGDEQCMMALIGDDIVEQLLKENDVDLDWLDNLENSPDNNNVFNSISAIEHQDCDGHEMIGSVHIDQIADQHIILSPTKKQKLEHQVPSENDNLATKDAFVWSGAILTPLEILHTSKDRLVPSTPEIIAKAEGGTSIRKNHSSTGYSPVADTCQSPTLSNITERFGRLKSPSSTSGGNFAALLKNQTACELKTKPYERTSRVNEPNSLPFYRHVYKRIDNDSPLLKASFIPGTAFQQHNNISLSIPSTEKKIRLDAEIKCKEEVTTIQPGITKVVQINDKNSSAPRKLVKIIVDSNLVKPFRFQGAGLTPGCSQIAPCLAAHPKAPVPRVKQQGHISFEIDEANHEIWPNESCVPTTQEPDSPFASSMGLLRGDENPLLSKPNEVNYPRINQQTSEGQRRSMSLASSHFSFSPSVADSKSKLASLLGIDEEPIELLKSDLHTLATGQSRESYASCSSETAQNIQVPSVCFIKEERNNDFQVTSPLFSQESGFHSAAGELSEKSDIYTPAPDK